MDGILIHVGTNEIFLHQSIVVWLGVCTFVAIFLIVLGQAFRKGDPTKTPTGVLLLADVLVNTAIGICGDNFKSKTWHYLPFYGTLMLCMVCSNLAGLLGVQAPTSNLSVCATLALICILTMHFTDIRLHGIVAKFKGWCEPFALLFPINVVGDLALPLSLTMRLFGNMLAGTIIFLMVYLLMKNLWPFSVLGFVVTPFLHAYFDVFSGCMQTYIFFTLTTYFMGESSDCNE